MKNTPLMQKLHELYSKYIEALSDEQRKKAIAYIYISLTLFTVSFFGFFAIAPTLTTILNLQKQYKDNVLVLEALNKKLSNLTLLDFQYKDIQQDLESIYSAIPRTPRMPYLTRQIEEIAKSSGIIIRKLTLGKVELYPNQKADPIYAFTFSVDITGDEKNINTFVSDLIGFDRIVGIDKISTGKNEDNRYEASIIGKAYFSNK